MANGAQVTPGVSLAGAVDLESLKHKASARPGAQGGAPAAGDFVTDVDESGFEAMVQASMTFPILLLFWTPDDDRMFAMARGLGDAVNAKNGQIQLCRIDAAQSQSIAQAFQLQGVPALFALIGGRPMPLMQGLPGDEEMSQLTDEVIPKIVDVAHRAGVVGTAPRVATSDGGDDPDGYSSCGQERLSPEHAKARQLAQAGDYAGAAEAYEQIARNDPSDAIAPRERAKALLLARSGASDVRVVRETAAANPDDVDSQLAVADVDMIGGQVEDAFGRLLDYLSAGHKSDVAAVRDRLIEYFDILDAGDTRVSRARRRLATLMY
ncbi:tetratricopeptide repeat protein [uncultured Bifidobacterium sp.]|uniref:tetratricopeptide repeat protein n=1 Tax=uncultured Bifidobacterium sp. TaxID=165187 RepID=UPI002611A1C3|nr:tetratricopeptide repeat protein [uncultured Bifidobacterium sp.]